MKKIVCLFSAVLMLTACSNDNDDSNPKTSVLPKTIELTNSAHPSENKISTITYDGNKIVSIANQTGKTEFTYKGNQIVQKVDYYISKNDTVKYGETSYTYVNGKLETVNKISNGNVSRDVYTYNSDGTVNKEMYSTNKTTGVETKSTENVTLSFVNSNLVKAVAVNGMYTTTTDYSYDTNNNVFRNIYGIGLLLDQKLALSVGDNIFSSVNNIEKSTVSVALNSNLVNIPSVYTSTYDYNADGFPTKKTTYNFDGTINEVFNYNF